MDGLVIIGRKKQQIFYPKDPSGNRSDNLVGSDDQFPRYQLKGKDILDGCSDRPNGRPILFWERTMRRIKAVISAEVTLWVVLLIYVGVLCYTQMAITREVPRAEHEQAR